MKRLITSGACVLSAFLGVSAYEEVAKKTEQASKVSDVVVPKTFDQVEVFDQSLVQEVNEYAHDSTLISPASPNSTKRSLGHAELKRRAIAVEAEANRELERLVRRLGLSSEQQDGVFAALAMTSPMYDSGMLVDPGAALAPTSALAVAGIESSSVPREEAIYDLLDPDQQDAYAEDIIDRQADAEAWWKELIEEIEQELVEGTPVVPVTPEVVPEVPVEGKRKNVTGYDFLTS